MTADFLTADEAAEILRVNAKTVIRLCRDRSLRHFKVGSLYRIRPEWIAEYADTFFDSNQGSDVAVSQSIASDLDDRISRLRGGRELTRTGKWAR